MDWMGMKVTVKLVVINRQATVSVVPSAASLIIRALNDTANKEHDGDITFQDVIDVAKSMRPPLHRAHHGWHCEGNPR